MIFIKFLLNKIILISYYFKPSNIQINNYYKKKILNKILLFKKN